jgi:hypothetical protein
MTPGEAQARIDHLESILKDRDRHDAEAKGAALAAENATSDAVLMAAKAEAAKAEIETLRKGSWLNFLLGQTPPAAPVDFAALDQQIPAAGWAPGVDPNSFMLTGGKLPKEVTIDVTKTHLGTLLLNNGRV